MPILAFTHHSPHHADYSISGIPHFLCRDGIHGSISLQALSVICHHPCLTPPTGKGAGRPAATLLCPLPEAGQSTSLQNDPVDRDTQLRILCMEIPGRGGQTLVIHQQPSGLQVYSAHQNRATRAHQNSAIIPGGGQDWLLRPTGSRQRPNDGVERCPCCNKSAS